GFNHRLGDIAAKARESLEGAIFCRCTPLIPVALRKRIRHVLREDAHRVRSFGSGRTVVYALEIKLCPQMIGQVAISCASVAVLPFLFGQWRIDLPKMMRLARAGPRAKVRQFAEPHIQLQGAACNRDGLHLCAPSHIDRTTEEPKRRARIGVRDDGLRADAFPAFKYHALARDDFRDTHASSNNRARLPRGPRNDESVWTPCPDRMGSRSFRSRLGRDRRSAAAHRTDNAPQIPPSTIQTGARAPQHLAPGDSPSAPVWAAPQSTYHARRVDESRSERAGSHRSSRASRSRPAEKDGRSRLRTAHRGRRAARCCRLRKARTGRCWPESRSSRAPEASVLQRRADARDRQDRRKAKGARPATALLLCTRRRSVHAIPAREHVFRLGRDKRRT